MYNLRHFTNLISTLTLIILFSLVIIINVIGTNAWLVLYLIECIIVLIAACASPFIGFIGFFWLTAIAGLINALAFLLKFNDFLGSSFSIAFESGANAKLGYTYITLSLYIDTISYSFSLLTALIGSAVYFYAFSYMRFEKNILNFLIYLEIFKLSMILLIWANSWFSLILGWELIGASSFLLINFWTSKITTFKSAFKALSFNKLSDAALISAACISLWFGAATIQSASHFGAILASKNINIGYSFISANDFFLVCLCIAAFCKSAQIGFHFWLPDSMEAPVPASALIHSATLVSAGIYLMLRFNFCFLSSPHIFTIFQIITATTAFYGAAVASFQTDVKKILAYSTISHCGMLMYSITLFRPEVTIFYLFAHGFFKSLNFLCVGNFIQYANNYQDISRMGGFSNLYKFELFLLFISTFNLSSAPLFLVFFSKHWLLSITDYCSLISASFIFSAAFCGFFYSSKLFYETLLSKKKAHHTVYVERAVKATSAHLGRKVNMIGIFGMCVLFIFACIMLIILFLQINTNSLWRADIWNSHTFNITANYQAALFLGFSYLLALIASSYLIFKRSNHKLAPLMLTFIAFITLCIY